MSARSKISIALRASQFTPDQAESLAQELYDAVAHELAGEGRKVMGPRALPSGPEPEHIARYVAGWHDAMDRIDPEVQK